METTTLQRVRAEAHLKQTLPSAIFLALGTRPDGYFGDRIECAFAYDPASKKNLIVTRWGWMSSMIPPCQDEQEARYQLTNHYLAKKYYIIDTWL